MTDIYKNKKLDLLNFFIPTYRISLIRTPVALIINGKRGVIRKMPKGKAYFIDKDFGMFEIIPEKAIYIDKTEFYIYDARNQNPLDPGLLNELWKWANFQHLYKIRRADISQAKRLRNTDLDTLKKDMIEEQRQTRAFMNRVLEGIKDKNKKIEQKMEQEGGGEDITGEYKKISDSDSNFLIVENLFNHGYIDAQQATILNHKLTIKQIKSTDDLLRTITDFTTVYVTQPITFEMERILDDYHTYKPWEVLSIIERLSKIRKGMKNLRSKPVINWFPSTYLLFGGVGVAIIIMFYLQYTGGGGSLGSFLPTP